jgi:hypothetical protein
MVCKTLFPVCVLVGMKRKTLIALLVAAIAALGSPARALDDKPAVNNVPVSADPDGVIRLLPGNASLQGEAIKIENHNGQAHIGSWTHPGDTVSWNIRVDQDGKYLVQVESAAANEGAVLLVQGIGKMALSVPKTADPATYQTSRVGEVSLAKGATITLTLRPVVDGWQPLNVRKVELVPQP